MAARRFTTESPPPSAIGRLFGRFVRPKKTTPAVSRSMTRAVKLWGFNHWIIARYILLRRELKLMEVDINRKNHVIYARRNSMGVKELGKYYVRECRYTPFFWEAGIDPFKRIRLADFSTSLDVKEFAGMLNADAGRVRRALKKHGGGFASLEGGVVRFDADRSGEFKLIIERITKLGERAEEISHMCIGDGYSFDIDGMDDAGAINRAMFREVADIVAHVEDRFGVQKAVPIEVNEMLSFQTALDSEMARTEGKK